MENVSETISHQPALTPVRDTHKNDKARLSRYLADHIDEV